MKITDIKSYSIESPVTDWTYVKIETDEPGLHGCDEDTLPTKPRGGRSQEAPRLTQFARDSQELEICCRHSYWQGGPIVTSAL